MKSAAAPNPSAAGCRPLTLIVWLALFVGCRARVQSYDAAIESPIGGRQQASKPQETSKMDELSKLADPGRMAVAPVVLRVVSLGPGNADKYAWARVRIVAVLKNTSGQDLGPELEVAYYSWKQGVPAGESTLYLEPYNDAPKHPWKLLGGSAEQGVSHAKS
jgi:hypothetical protein